MNPILFAPSATSFTPITNGLGRLSDAVSCKVIEELNGQYELEMSYPVSGRLFSSIVYSSIIVAKPFQNGNLQAFRVYKISKPMKGLVNIYARHISYQLNHIPCSSFSGQSCAQVMAAIPTAVAEYCPFTFSTDITENRTSLSKNLVASLDDNDDDIPHYNPNAVYNVNDYCKYVDVVYRCTVAITTPEPWNSKHWTRSSVVRVGILTCYIDNNGRFVDPDPEPPPNVAPNPNPDAAACVWVKCEKSKQYSISKLLGGCFTIGSCTNVPTEGDTVLNIKKVPTERKTTYTTTANAEYLVIYCYRKSIDGEERYENILNSLSVRAIGTYSWMLYEPKCIRTFLLGTDDNSIQAIYGGEYEWDNYNVKLWQNRGSDKGVKIRYGKNLIDLTQEENIENTITGIYPIWKNDGTVVELTEKVLHAANASLYPYYRTVIQDFTSDFDEMPTEEDLREYAQLFIQNENIGVPEVSLTVNFVNLSDTLEYNKIDSLQTVNLGDLVTVEFPDLDVNAKQKVTKTEFDVLADRYTSVTIGDLEKRIDKTLEDQMNEISQKVTEEEAQNKIDRATGVMNAGTRGHVIIGRNDDGFANEIYFLDNTNVALAKDVLRINVNGIGFSSTGFRGPYFQAWTLDGHLTLGGVNNNHGTLEILDSNGETIGIWTKDGLHVYGGIIESGQFRSKNGEFYVMENDDQVELGWSGWFVEDGMMMSNQLKWHSNRKTNPTSANSASAAMHGGCQADEGCNSNECEEDETVVENGEETGYPGTASFQAIWLDDDGFYRQSTVHSYKGRGASSSHLWDVGESLLWLFDQVGSLDTRVRALEGCASYEGCPTNQCAGDCQSYDPGCPGEACDEIPCGGGSGDEV